MKILKKVGRWAVQRAKEPTTLAGAAAIATALGAPALGAKIGLVGQVLVAAGLIGGGGLVAHQQDRPAA